jgi:hypothetical protein
MVICQNQKNFNKEIKNIRHNLMLNKYTQESADSIMKPSRRNCPSSDTIHQSMIITPYVKSISVKFRCTGNHFCVRNIFKTNHTLHGTMIKTGPLRDAQQMKQCVYNIPCHCDRCYSGKTSRPLDVCIKEYKHNLSPKCTGR